MAERPLLSGPPPGSVPPGISQAPDGGFRRWTLSRGWVPTFEAKAFSAPGFEGVVFFTCVVHENGHVGFGAFDAATGLPLEEVFHPSRPLAEQAAKSHLRAKGRAEYDERVAEVLAGRGDGR